MNEKVKVKANVKITLFSESGEVEDIVEVHNTISPAGLEALAAQLMISPDKAKPGWMEVGEGVPSGVLLGNPVAGSRIPIAHTSRTENKAAMFCSFAAGVGTGILTEAGVFNSATDNTEEMLLYTRFRAINKTASKPLTISWFWTVY